MNMMMEFDFQRVEINDWRSIWVNSPSMILANCNASVLIFVEIEKNRSEFIIWMKHQMLQHDSIHQCEHVKRSKNIIKTNWYEKERTAPKDAGCKWEETRQRRVISGRGWWRPSGGFKKNPVQDRSTWSQEKITCGKITVGGGGEVAEWLSRGET